MAGACSYMPVESGGLVKKCCIAGLGLIGCSLGLALGKHGLALERWGYDIAPQARKEAEARGAVDKTAPLAQALDGKDSPPLPVHSADKFKRVRKIDYFFNERCGSYGYLCFFFDLSGEPQDKAFFLPGARDMATALLQPLFQLRNLFFRYVWIHDH